MLAYPQELLEANNIDLTLNLDKSYDNIGMLKKLTNKKN